MEQSVVVALDAMGGDNAPGEIVRGAVDAVKEDPHIRVVLVGKEDVVRKELSQYSYPEGAISIAPASEVIDPGEHPVAAIRKKKDSSIVVGLKMVKEGHADAFVSAGSSGAILVGGQVIVGRIRGIERAPFAAMIPTKAGVSLLLDSGANVDARPDHMVQFARMGSIYMQDVVGIASPKVGLLNIGAEEDKGNALVKETYPLLRACDDLNFVGSVEARDIPMGGTDVIVSEAFAGNVALKMYEGTAKMLQDTMKEALLSNLKTKIGALLIKSALKEKLKAFDASIYGGAPMLGLNALVVKTHGSAKAKEIHNSILQCRQFQEQEIARKIRERIAT